MSPSRTAELPFGMMTEPATPASGTVRNHELSANQRIAVIVKTLNNGLNPMPLNRIIRGIEDNHSEGGSDTTLLWFERPDGAKDLFEVTLAELRLIQERRIAGSRLKRQRRLPGL